MEVINSLQRRGSNYRINYLPYAVADVNGSESHEKIKGKVKFYPWKNGSIVKIEVEGLPNSNKNNFFGFHIHEGSECSEKEGEKAFLSAGGHLNTENDEHPQHVGDLPLLYSNDGYAYMEFFTNRFTPNDVISHTVIIHEHKDDLITDPAGNSGDRIACGEIVRFR